MEWILYIFAGIGILAIVGVIAYYIQRKMQFDKNHTGEHHCNFCEISFLYDDEVKYKYCPHCGEKLTLHKEALKDQADPFEQVAVEEELLQLKEEVRKIKVRIDEQEPKDGGAQQ